MQLSADDQRNLRDAAADAWKQSSGLWRRLHARELFKKDPRVAKFDVATVILLVRIAWKLWEFWRETKISNPSDVLDERIHKIGDYDRAFLEVFEPSFGGTQ